VCGWRDCRSGSVWEETLVTSHEDPRIYDLLVDIVVEYPFPVVRGSIESDFPVVDQL